jgi:hypothetical protein
MTLKEAMQRVAMGEEFSFYYNDESYWISHNEDGFYLTKEINGDTQEFNSSEELFNKSTIDGIQIKEIWYMIDV